MSASTGSSVRAGSLLSPTNPGQEGSPAAEKDGRLAHVSKEQYCLILGPQDLKQSGKDARIYTQTDFSSYPRLEEVGNLSIARLLSIITFSIQNQGKKHKEVTP